MAQILVIEDEQALVDVIKTVLTGDGHTVLQAYDGETGLEMARRDKPSLIIADQMLPIKTGLDVCRALKAEQPEPPIPFLLMTAANVPLTDACPDSILRKPFALEELQAQVASLLEKRAPSFFG